MRHAESLCDSRYRSSPVCHPTDRIRRSFESIGGCREELLNCFALSLRLSRDLHKRTEKTSCCDDAGEKARDDLFIRVLRLKSFQGLFCMCI